jgi:hypothetical protein
MAHNNIKSFSVSMEVEVVKRAKKVMDELHFNAPLSPILNTLLRKWVEEQELILWKTREKKDI